MIRNNQNGRRRGRGGARPPQQGGGPSGNYGNTNGGGSRIDTRQRGNATQLLEKYKAMARDATQNGDRVQAEFYMQYADHYFRVLNEFRARDPQPAPRQAYDDDDDGYGAPMPGQNYAPASERDDDDGDEAAAGGDRGNGVGGSERGDQAVSRGNGERPRGNDAYAGNRREPRDDRRDDRDANRQRQYGQRDGAGDSRSDAPRRDDMRSGSPNGRDSSRDGSRDLDHEGRDGAPRRADERAGRGETVGRDDRSGASSSDGRDATRDDGGRGAYARRDATSETPRNGRDVAEADPVSPSREPALREAAMREPDTLMGLPGPATIAPAAGDAAAVASDPAETPAPRRRGRPRKVVAAADSSDG